MWTAAACWFPLSPVTGQDGNHYIGLEEPFGVALSNPNAVVLTDIDIAGYENLGISLLCAAPSAAQGRYEITDHLEAQYRVDDGPSWVTVGRFIGAGAGVVGRRHDVNLDGIQFTPVTSAMQRFAYTLCDGANLASSTCSSRDFDYGTLACSNDCSAHPRAG